MADEKPTLTRQDALQFVLSEARIAEELGAKLGYINSDDETRSKERIEKLKATASLLRQDELAVGEFITIEELEVAHIKAIVAKTPNLHDAAHILGIDIATLYRKRRKHGMEMRG